MQAAIFAAQRGHEVWLVERCGHLGGKLVAASAPPHKHRVRLFLEYLKAEIEASSVNVAVGREDATDVARELRPDAVIVATGASPLVPEIPGVKTGMERGEVLLAEDVLGTGLTFPGRKLAVAGGGMVGCETAEYLASQGADVTILEMTRELASDVEPISRSALLQRIEHLGIKIFAGHALASWSAGTILTDQGVALRADLLVLALGYRPSASTAEEWARYGRYVFPIGDARRPGRILDATGDAVECVCELERRLG
jgi:pyruvate/2-oxoglutarate dehydrogenase complex dihydrolipoamide dehydrogenase (E3) component